jgi:hypothetical protein
MTEPVPPEERESPDWMERPIDDRIVETLAEDPKTPAELIESLDADPYTIRTRLQVLGMHYFLDLDEGQQLVLTHRSRTFLEGENSFGCQPRR